MLLNDKLCFRLVHHPTNLLKQGFIDGHRKANYFLAPSAGQVNADWSCQDLVDT